MVTLTDVWKCLTVSNTAPRGMPEGALQAIDVDPDDCGAQSLLIVLPEHSKTACPPNTT
jgi:hypothetical protein